MQAQRLSAANSSTNAPVRNNRAGPSPFAALGVSAQLCGALDVAGYQKPTPIQRQAIPHVLEGKDLLGCAQTGTGKTAAFALPILQNIMATPRPEGRSRRGAMIQSLVLAPTRELAAQIGASFAKYGGRNGPRHLVVFGGVGKQGQVQALRRGVEVLVATPGRLLDLMGDGEVQLDQVKTFVLDEADRMLDMGFIHDVRRVSKALPSKRQTLLFSATMPKEIQELADRILHKPVRVAVDPISSTREPIAQSVYLVAQSQKSKLLISLLDDASLDRVLVFTRTKHGANRVAEKLTRAGINAAAIHGNKSQSARVRALDGFKAGKIRVVVATDIAARGIDIKDLSYVVNFDLPNEPESYVHRVGRTGRAGKSGIAIAFCSEQERSYLRDIERLTKRRIEVCKNPPGFAERAVPVREAARTQGRVESNPRASQAKPKPNSATTRRRRRSNRGPVRAAARRG